MLYLKEISKDKKFFKVIYSIEREDIEFIWSKETIINGIKNNRNYKTVYYNNDKLLEGADVILQENHLVTVKNDKIEDNLSELPIF